MRITIPLPKYPLTLDTSQPFQLFRATGGGRRSQIRLLILGLLIIGLLTVQPSPPFPVKYEERKIEGSIGRENRSGKMLRFDLETKRKVSVSRQLMNDFLFHHVAAISDRAFAYEPIAIDETILPFKLTRWPFRSARIPLSAYISSITSGFEAFSKSPRAVPVSTFKIVCTRENTYTIELKDTGHPQGIQPNEDGSKLIHQLQLEMKQHEESCIRIKGDLFNDQFFRSTSSLTMFESLIQSPVLKHYYPSKRILSIINQVLPDLSPESTPYRLDRTYTPTQEGKQGQWKQVLALELRGGTEWDQTCKEAADHSYPFYAFNKLPKHPGNENVPPPTSITPAARQGLYKAKCQPEVLDILSRARRLRKNHPMLKVVYIITDDQTSKAYWAEVKKWLLSEGWDKVMIGEKDVWGKSSAREVGEGVDLEISRRAGMYVGNGFSVFSSNVVLLRRKDGTHTDLTQFW